MNESITIPHRAAHHIAQLIAAQQAAEQQLRSAVQLLAAALGAPDGQQLHVQPDGGMIFAPPAGSDNTGSE
jgi:hypothetical protein